MATHDYVIDNSTGANVRADINNVLQAILITVVLLLLALQQPICFGLILQAEH